MIRNGFLVLIATLCAAGCGCGRTSPGVPPGATTGSGKVYSLPSEVAPGAMYSPKAKLTLGRDTVVMVDVKQKEQDGGLTLDLIAHGQSFEKEIYRSDPNAFYLVCAVGVEYEQPIKLLQFPLHVGDSWTWTGKLSYGGHSSNGRATIVTSADRLLLPSATADTILVEVKLEIDNGTPAWAQRKLSFWFLPGKGIVRRSFGTSARDPVE